MKKLLSALLLGLSLLLTACGDKPGEQFVGKWQNPNAYFQFEIKRNEANQNSDSFVVKAQGKNPLEAATLEGKLLNDTLIVNHGTIQLTIDKATGEMIDETGMRYKKAE